MRLLSFAAFAFVVFFAPAARADNRAAAEALFVEGRRAMDQGSYAEACAKFEASDTLDPAVGTELNLATCWEKLGKTASAWGMYNLVATSSAGRADRAKLAADHAAALWPTLSKLTVTLPTTPAGVRVTLDGKDFRASVAVPVDPGHHVVEASVTNRPHFRREIDIAAGGATTTIAVTL